MNRVTVLNFVRVFRAVDVVIIVFGVFLSLFNLLFSSMISDSRVLIIINLIAIAGILTLAHAAARSGNVTLKFLFDWYPAPLIFFSFKEMYVIIQSMGRKDFDDILIAIDRWMFGGDPTVWLSRFASPMLTETLQIAYASFYLIMITLGAELYIRREHEKFCYVLLAILYGFFLSFIGYLSVPAVGPRFTLHNFDAINNELPGLWFTNGIRDILNAGESIPKGVLNPVAFAQRDVFPSGHTQMTLIVMFLARRYKVKSRYVLYLFGTLLIISTVYLRYHYVVDLIVGGIFMWFTLWTAPKIEKWWQSVTGK